MIDFETCYFRLDPPDDPVSIPFMIHGIHFITGIHSTPTNTYVLSTCTATAFVSPIFTTYNNMSNGYYIGNGTTGHQ